MRTARTIPILILLTAVFSTMLTIGIRIYDACMPANQVPVFKYRLTLGIACAAGIYTTLFGRRIIRENFGALGGRQLTLTGAQAALVTAYVLVLSVYLTWCLMPDF